MPPETLRDLERQGIVTRIRRGLWAVPGHPDFSPYAVVPHLFTDGRAGYVSLLSALSLQGMIEQIPRVVHIVTTSLRPVLKTPVATYAFHRIEEALFGGFAAYRRTGSFDIAAPEKAVFDTLYFSARKGRRFVGLPEVDLPPTFPARGVEHWIGMITDPPLRNAVSSPLASAGAASGAGRAVRASTGATNWHQGPAGPASRVNPSLLPAGRIARNATELLSSNMMETFLEELKEKLKDWFLIIDSPPCQIMAETKSMAQRVDGIILVVMAGKTPRKDLEKAIENLGNEKILGVVFNGYEKALKNYYRYYDQYCKRK